MSKQWFQVSIFPEVNPVLGSCLAATCSSRGAGRGAGRCNCSSSETPSHASASSARSGFEADDKRLGFVSTWDVMGILWAYYGHIIGIMGICICIIIYVYICIYNKL